MRLPATTTLKNRGSTTAKDGRMLNSFAEQKGGVIRAVKRPSLVGTFAAMQGGAGPGQWLFAWTTPDGVETLAGIQNDVLDNSPTPIASRLAFSVQPADWKVSTAISPSIVVQARDLTGAVKTSFTGDVTLSFSANPNGGTLSGTLTVAAIAGVATFSNVKIDKVGGGYKVKATASLMKPATSDVFKIVSSQSFTVQPSFASAGATLDPVEVSIVDASSNVITGYVGNVTVAIGSNGGSPAGTLSGTLTVAAVSGVASFANLSIDESGTYTLVASASAGGLANVTSNSFAIGVFSLTSATITVEGTTYFGMNKDLTPDLGSISPTSFGGNTINILATTNTNGITYQTSFQVAAIVSQSAFTSIAANGKTLLSADAIFVSGGGVSSWIWSGTSSSNANMFAATGSISVEIE